MTGHTIKMSVSHLKKRTYRKRCRFLFEQKLCYGSFSPISASHNATNCKKRKECKVCKKRHPTSLYDCKTEKNKEKLKSRAEKDNEQKDVHCATVNMSLEVIRMCVVHVMVRHKLSNRVVKTYAMLNTSSQATFATENLLSDLGIQGRKTSIMVKTMNGEVIKLSEALEDLEVAQASNGKAEKVWVTLLTHKKTCLWTVTKYQPLIK